MILSGMVTGNIAGNGSRTVCFICRASSYPSREPPEGGLAQLPAARMTESNISVSCPAVDSMNPLFEAVIVSIFRCVLTSTPRRSSSYSRIRITRR